MLPKSKIRPPVCIAIGSPREVGEIVEQLDFGDITCYQMDLHQAQKLEAILKQSGKACRVVTKPDLWDLEQGFQTVVFPAAESGERSLSLDMVEHAHHILHPGGVLVVTTPHSPDQVFGPLMKRVFKNTEVSSHATGSIFWSRKDKDRPRRRHEVTFHAKILDGPSCHFLTRPGTFSFGRMDRGARAMMDVAVIERGQRVLDLGCGCGTNGVLASVRSGPMGEIVFVDSNVRAVQLAEHNARTNGVSQFQAIATADVAVGTPESFDVVLANPPYYADGAIAELFLKKARELLRQGGKLFMVSKLMQTIGARVVDEFPETEIVHHRGYLVFCSEN